MASKIVQKGNSVMTLNRTRALLLLVIVAAVFGVTDRVVSAPALPNPVLYFIISEPFQQSGKTFVRYKYDVFNKDQYPAEMFAASPNLPPCGKNTKASRTWVDLYDQSGKRLYGFCALSGPKDLNQLYFAIEDGVVPPSWIYIEMTDRQTNTKYKSNLAETTN
jgi:hypothetical protein